MTQYIFDIPSLFITEEMGSTKKTEHRKGNCDLTMSFVLDLFSSLRKAI